MNAKFAKLPKIDELIFAQSCLKTYEALASSQAFYKASLTPDTDIVNNTKLMQDY